MSLKNLPPVWESWYMEDLEGLTREEMESLQALLKNKIEFVTDRYEHYLFFKDRERYMRLKEVEMKEKRKISTSTVRSDLKSMFLQ